MPDIKHFDPDAALETIVRLFWRDGVVSTGVQDIVDATGVSRSSLYATFGDKQALYVTALRSYLQKRSVPNFDRLAADGRGLPAVREFFVRLIAVRSTGEFARWGCLASNAQLPGTSRTYTSGRFWTATTSGCRGHCWRRSPTPIVSGSCPVLSRRRTRPACWR